VSRDYRHAKWVPWYIEDTQSWLELSLMARGAMAELARKFNAKGEIHLRRGLSSLAFLLRVDWERELEPALAELIAVGKVTWDGARFVLADPQWVERQRMGSAERMRDLRARRKSDVGDASDVTSVTSVTTPHVTPVLVSSDLVSSGSSDLGSGSPRRTDPPEWWTAACETVEMTTGVKLRAAEAWLRYAGHRRSNAKPMTHDDAVYWLTTVDVREARQERHREQREKDQDAARRERKVDYTPKYEQPTREQSKAMVAALAACVQQRKAAGT